MTTILVTAFEPFGGAKTNPSLDAVMRLDAPCGVALTRLVLPTSYARSFEVLRREAKELRPQAILSVGQAGGRAAITPERVAINVADAALADNDGVVLVDEPVSPGGRSAYFSTLPVKRICAAIAAAGVPCELSDSAGTFVCNRVMYGALEMCERELPGTLAGFIHVPYTPDEAPAGKPSVALCDTVRALEIALAEIAGHVEGR